MWLLPSLARPASLARFFAAFRATGGSTPGMVLIDAADHAARSADYDALEVPVGWHLRVTEGVTQGDKIREVWDEIVHCAWLGLIGDDNVPETPGWDRTLVQALDGWNLVSCDDGWQAPKRVANCWVMSGKLVRAAGYIFPPGLHHLFVDDVWETIGRETHCWTVRMDVTVRHRHVMTGAAAPDATHRAVYGDGDRSKSLWPGDEAAYRAWLDGDRHRLVASVREARQGMPAHPRVTVALRQDPDDEAPDARSPEEERRLARVKSRSVMICTPIARAPAWQYTFAFAETCVMLDRLGVRYGTQFVIGSSNLARARNTLAARFMASGFDDLLFIDDDMGWQPNSVLRLLASEQPLIAGVGRKKVKKPNTDPDVWCAHFDPGAQGRLESDEMGNVEALGTGTAFMKISRVVFETMIAAHPEWKVPCAPEMPAAVKAAYHAFFRFGDEEQGEDFVFCDRWRALGGRVFIDPSIELTHVGEEAYTGRIAELMTVRSAPAADDAAHRREAAE